MFVRKGTVEDVEVIWSLMQDAFSEYTNDVLPSSALQETLQTIKAAMEKGEQSLILLDDEEPIGMVRYTMHDDYYYFFRLSVKRSHQSKGCAKKLLIALEEEAVRHNISFIQCKVRANVQRNMDLYKNVGYKQCSEEIMERENIQLTIALFEKPLVI
ncbi:GNAT family N-acetyltransferase [Lysinibacillus sp. LZ02]|uniref:GNAT family N-acetyltransferase n=1 Tax=Lysinibacillus sp. LZ02 TaxID=3420668 RepID=UPI003D35E7B9